MYFALVTLVSAFWHYGVLASANLPTKTLCAYFDFILMTPLGFLTMWRFNISNNRDSQQFPD